MGNWSYLFTFYTGHPYFQSNYTCAYWRKEILLCIFFVSTILCMYTYSWVFLAQGWRILIQYLLSIVLSQGWRFWAKCPPLAPRPPPHCHYKLVSSIIWIPCVHSPRDLLTSVGPRQFELSYFDFPVISNSKSFPSDLPFSNFLSVISNPAISTYFSFPLRVWNSGVQLYLNVGVRVVILSVTCYVDLSKGLSILPFVSRVISPPTSILTHLTISAQTNTFPVYHFAKVRPRKSILGWHGYNF